jgi:hypothetical protein
MRQRRFLEFGKYLKDLRQKTRLTADDVEPPTQQYVANTLTDWLAKRAGGKSKKTVSQGLIAQLEGGRIIDPDPAMLAGLASIYGRKYEELVVALMREKFDFDDRWRRDPCSRLAWDAFLTALSDPTLVQSVVNEVGAEHRDRLRQDLLRSWIGQRATPVLDIEGMANWQQYFHDLQEFWVIAPNFLDDRDDFITSAVIHNLNRGVKYAYFIYGHETVDRFHDLQKVLLREAKRATPQQVVAYDLDEIYNAENDASTQKEAADDRESTRWLSVDYIIANPCERPRAAGFQTRREAGSAVEAHRLTKTDLNSLLDQWRNRAASRFQIKPKLDVVGMRRGRKSRTA